MWIQCDDMRMHGFDGTRVLLFIMDRRRQMNSEMYHEILSAQMQPDAEIVIGQRFPAHVDNDPNHAEKATRVLRVIKSRTPFNSSDCYLILTHSCMHFTY